jgi:hypothetical protein
MKTLEQWLVEQQKLCNDAIATGDDTVQARRARTIAGVSSLPTALKIIQCVTGGAWCGAREVAEKIINEEAKP